MKQIINAIISNDIHQIETVSEQLVVMGKTFALDEQLVNTFRLVFDELLSNVVTHAYGDNQVHHIEVRAYLDSYFIAVIEHDGVYFDPKNAPKPDLYSSIEERKIGGLGVYLVDNLINEVRYLNKENKRLIILKHKL